jgi:PQQ-like domain
MRSWRPLLLALPLLGAVMLAAGDSAAANAGQLQVPTGGDNAAAATTLWPAYHLDRRRSGNDLGEPSFTHLAKAWTSTALDGAMYAEPLVDGGNVIVATENNSVYAFATATGSPAWGPVHLGAPRTANFPCGNINPLGITGTPVIDGGFLYVVAEVQTSPTTYEWDLAKVDPSNGAITYDRNITPAGMDTNVQQERSALNVSQGNVVITWGGMAGDCGDYHGYVETVSEATGLELHQWNSTSEPGGSEGGIWGASGPAVDALGNIYVTTGNGSSSDITNYDFGDSVVKFSPALAVKSWFAPGPPQSWASLNANDDDLASIGPSLLNRGLLFAIGKGGRGYILNQSALPDNSNPGGGENYSAQVCNSTHSAAFGGLAVHGNTVFVPCTDGIAAVVIDSATAFHRVWYQTTRGGSPAIYAGGLIWTVGSIFGGTTLNGLVPATGVIVSRLVLPAITVHFATPAAGDGMLFIADADLLVAFK